MIKEYTVVDGPLGWELSPALFGGKPLEFTLKVTDGKVNVSVRVTGIDQTEIPHQWTIRGAIKRIGAGEDRVEVRYSTLTKRGYFQITGDI